MLQFIISFLPLLAIIAAVFTMAFKVKHSGMSMIQILDEFGFSVENSPAQVAFFVFSFAAAAAVTLACAFAHVSNQFILSLDILFFLSNMLLILYHRFKEYATASL